MSVSRYMWLAWLSMCLVPSVVQGAFIGLTVEDVTDNDDGLTEFALFAKFDDTNDLFLDVHSVNITVTTKFFHSTINGAASALPWTKSQNSQSSNPDADSFVTVGLWTGDNNTTALFPTFDEDLFLDGNSLGMNAGWTANPASGQGKPDKFGRVLLAVFTPTLDEQGDTGVVSGSLKVAYKSGGLVLHCN